LCHFKSGIIVFAFSAKVTCFGVHNKVHVRRC
jgi:hypothetical protein